MFGLRIREERRKKNMSLTTLAREAKISTTYLSNIEFSRSMPSVRVFVNIANALCVSADDLLCEELSSSRTTQMLDELIETLQHLSPEKKHNANAVLKTYFEYIFELHHKF